MKDDQQPAFPTWKRSEDMAEGMTLRDYFAAQAMINANFSYESKKTPQRIDQSEAKWCYEIADSMLKARSE